MRILKNVKAWLNHYVGKRFLIFRALYFVKYTIDIILAGRLIIVATPGHVGSSTLFLTLKGAEWEKGTKVFDIHSLNERTRRSNYSARHILQDVLRVLLRLKLGSFKEFHIVTVVRDPIARALGAIFQSPQKFLSQFEADLTDNEAHNLEQVKRFMIDTDYLAHTVKYQLSFYQKEIPKYYGLLLDMKGFCRSGNAHFKANNNCSFSILTLENFDSDIPSFFERHFQVSPKLRIANTNASRGDKYSPLYEYCKSNLKFERDIIDNIYCNDFLADLYGNEQVECFKRRWLHK